MLSFPIMFVHLTCRVQSLAFFISWTTFSESRTPQEFHHQSVKSRHTATAINRCAYPVELQSPRDLRRVPIHYKRGALSYFSRCPDFVSPRRFYPRLVLICTQPCPTHFKMAHLLHECADWRRDNGQVYFGSVLVSGSLLMGSSVAYPMLSQDGSAWAPVYVLSQVSTN